MATLSLAAHCAAASLAARPNRASASAAKLRLRPANALRLAPARASVQSRRSGVAVQAVALPPLLPLAARAVAAFFVFYSSMNWVFYRGTRKDAEKFQEGNEERRASRRSMVDKLTGRTPKDSGKGDN